MRASFCWKKVAFPCRLQLFSLLLLLVPCAAPGANISAGIGFEAASGSYGTGTRTESVYAPVTLALSPTERLGFSLEIPYVYQSNTASNTGIFTGDGGQMHLRKSAESMTMGPGSMGATSGGTGARRDGGTQSGLGDIIARAGYVLVPQGELMPRVRPYLFVRFPTGDKEKALGTGAFAEGFAVEAAKEFGNWYTFAEAGFTFQGSSHTLLLKDYVTYDAGAGYLFADRYLPMLAVKGSGAPVEGSSDLLEMRIRLKYMVTERTGMEGYVAKGITRNSPDYGGGLAIYHDF